MKRTDKALETARLFLTGTICECGHTEGEHRCSENWPKKSPAKYGRFCEPRCRCQAFTPASFTVERA